MMDSYNLTHGKNKYTSFAGPYAKYDYFNCYVLIRLCDRMEIWSIEFNAIGLVSNHVLQVETIHALNMANVMRKGTFGHFT